MSYSTEIDERFAAEQRRHWQSKLSQSSGKKQNADSSLLRFSSGGPQDGMDPRAKLRPEGKPYAKLGGIFGDLVALLPLENGEEIEKFESLSRKFTRIHGPLALASTRNEEEKPLIWYAVDTNDPIAAELLLGQGAASSAFCRMRGGKTAFEHAYAKRYERVVRVLNNWAHRELADVMDNDQSLTINNKKRKGRTAKSNSRSNTLFDDLCRPSPCGGFGAGGEREGTYITTCECPLCSPSADASCNPCLCLMRRTAPALEIQKDDDNDDDDDDDEYEEE